MLKNWLQKTLLLTSVFTSLNAFAVLDNQILKDELYRITSYSLKSNIYSIHIAANDFSDMKPSELTLNQKNIDKLLESPSIQKNSTKEEREDVRQNIYSLLEQIYFEKDPQINQAGVLHIPMGSNIVSLISIPNIYYTNYSGCAGPFILFDAYTCFQLNKDTRSFITKYIRTNYVNSLSSDYLGYFTIIHEYAHTFPEQLRLDPMTVYKPIHNEKVKKDMNLIFHYNEMYSDLYASIRMLQLGYKKKDLEQVIFMRDAALYLYDDLAHYSSPYIKLLISKPTEKYMEISSMDEYDELIKEIFFEVINEKNTMDAKNFYFEQLEMKEKISDIARFINSINRNTILNDENIEYIVNLFNTFIQRVYFSNRKFDLRFNKNR